MHYTAIVLCFCTLHRICFMCKCMYASQMQNDDENNNYMNMMMLMCVSLCVCVCTNPTEMYSYTDISYLRVKLKN